ncbi:MAG: lipid asymmetry maintenance protein MlaB [Burkholderiales bacterium]
MTIYTAAAIKTTLLAALHSGDTTLDLAQVSEIDTAGLQLLFLARREGAARGTPVRFVNPSRAVLELFTLCHLTDAFGAAEEPKP